MDGDLLGQTILQNKNAEPWICTQIEFGYDDMTGYLLGSSI